MVTAAVTSPEVLVLAVLPGWVRGKWGETSRSVPAVAARFGGGWVFGDSALDSPDAIDVTDTVDDPAAVASPRTDGHEPGPVLTGLVCYAAAAVGAPSMVATAVVVHPTWWNERRRRLLDTAARQVAHNVLLVPVSVAACRAAHQGDAERYVVLEFAERGVTAVSVMPGSRDDGPAVDRVARNPEILVDDLVAADAGDTVSAEGAVRSLIAAVNDGREDSCVLVVTGAPGEPAGGSACEQIANRIAGTVPTVPVAAAEMVAAVSGRRVQETAPAETASTVPWLHEVRTPGTPATRNGRTAKVILAVVSVGLLAAVSLWVGAPAPSGSVAGAGTTGDGAGATDSPASAADPDLSQPRTDRPARFEIGPVRLDLPGSWRLRTPESADSGRAELVPASGTDRRIVIVHSVLADGMDEHAVAAVLGTRAEERGRVIRNMDADTTFADRSVIAYTEVPDEFSEVRWSVVVFPGLQVAVGCQFLDGEWAGIRRECEQAVHTLRTG
ncbi:type VII secretion-associated protein [Rhodococcus sp. BL-253-APC-6A1W]|uniref:type VII secretion-associated protein n=1 Tax=Rhodococcus sp. BL-253-APC-6A1W TaxID=2725307 RepID=UPI00146B8895|nr:type VII secretion-associated protein [Rhodococcus sp. BL-253-APC-6A1W]NMD94636.1 type VII secretion-associated protein [Rhodococcus sp. BL-253-APC-6A1W]